MREIIFKAKRIDNGEWAEGLLWKKKYHSNVIFISFFPDEDDREEICRIDEKTICQYTGLTDKNGNKIWENDIVKTQEYADRPYSDKSKSKRHVGVVEYYIGQGNGFYNKETGDHNKHCEYSAKWCVKIKDYGKYHCGNWGDFFDCEVIGNIFDNPELLES